MHPHTSPARRLPQDLWERLSPREQQILADRLESQEQQAAHLRSLRVEETEPVLSFSVELPR